MYKHDSSFFNLLRCLECSANLELEGQALVCSACRASYHIHQGKPVLLRRDNPLFSADAYQEMEADPLKPLHFRSRLASRLKALVPSRSVNLCRDRLLRQIVAKYDRDAVVLVVGCGTQKSELSTFFTNSAVQLIFSDIDQSADCDIYADAHHLPFEDQAFDGVITTAVLEHVLDPWCVAREIVRVTKYSGIVYSELPFMQGVHEGAYDFTRFTMGGHRNLFSHYRELDSGVVAGPGTAFVWAISSLFRSLFKSDRLSVCADLMSRVLFGWVKYVDYLIARHPIAEDFASCTYFYGEKKRVPLSPGELIDAYKRKHCDHLN